MFAFISGWHVGQTRVPDVGPGVFREGATRRRRAPPTSPAPLTSGLFTLLIFPHRTDTHTHTLAHSLSRAVIKLVLIQLSASAVLTFAK